MLYLSRDDHSLLILVQNCYLLIMLILDKSPVIDAMSLCTSSNLSDG